MTKLLTFTEKAVAHIQGILKNHAKGSHFRLSVKQTGCSGYMYVPDIVQAPKSTDVVVPFHNENVCYVDQDCISIIEGTEVDFVKKDFGMSQLSFNNPNADSLCGCGESFNLKAKDD